MTPRIQAERRTDCNEVVLHLETALVLIDDADTELARGALANAKDQVRAALVAIDSAWQAVGGKTAAELGEKSDDAPDRPSYKAPAWNGLPPKHRGRPTIQQTLARVLADGPLGTDELIRRTKLVATSAKSTLSRSMLEFRQNDDGLWELTQYGRQMLLKPVRT